MAARFPLRLPCAGCLAVVLAFGCAPRADDPVAKSDKNEEEYIKQKASAVLDALLVGDKPGVQGTMTEKMLKGINPSGDGVSVGNWIIQWNSRKLYKSYTIDKVAFSPTKDEVVLSGSLTGKDDAVKGTFTMTFVKEKDKYMLEACSHMEK